MGPFRARAFGGHEDAGVEQISCEVARQKRVEDSSRQERLVVETQARPSSKRGKIKAIKSRVEEVGSSRAMRCFNAAVRRGTNGGRPKFLSTPKVRFVQKCQKMVRCQACRKLKKLAIRTGTKYRRSLQLLSSVSKGRLISISVRTRPDAMYAGIAHN